jgi:hypothetical protein
VLNIYFSLRINASEDKYKIISKILNIKPVDLYRGWMYEIEISQEQHYDFINVFMDILEGHYEELANIGIFRKAISIWMIYEYNQQCNLEFLPKDMKRLGDNEITLCISCYDASDIGLDNDNPHLPLETPEEDQPQ